MKLIEFAQSILFGSTLEEKLFFPEKLDFDSDQSSPWGERTDVQPGRPKSLALDAWHHRKKVPFPSLASLNQASARGLVMHFFANHELLALELMALALLRFGDAPKAFLRGIVSAMKDEQKHLRLYLNRMNDLGVSFGDLPVNDFFWSKLSDMKSPMDFVTRMSLTFEQANLDHSLFYKKKFELVNDLECSKIMDVVLEDEIRHVAHGVSWFQEWKNKEESDWETYVRMLPYPITPARAKGSQFDFEVRKKAGLSDSFINRLYLYSHSKGRPPDVYLFVPNLEDEIASGKASFEPNQVTVSIRSDLEILMMFLTSHDDVLLVDEIPNDVFLSQWVSCGVRLPELIRKSEMDVSSLKSRTLGALKPWGWSEHTKMWMEKNLAVDVVPYKNVCNTSAILSSKVYQKKLFDMVCRQMDLVKSGASPISSTFMSVCSDSEEVLAVVQKLFSLYKNIHYVVVKEPFGSAGRNRKRFSRYDFFEPQNLEWLRQQFKKYPSLLVQPWLDRVADFSYHGKISKGAGINLGVTRFFTDHRGQYLGSLVTRKTDFLDAKTKRDLYVPPEGGVGFFEQLDLAFQEVVKALVECNYEGPFSFDAMACRDGDLLVAVPFLELNPRFTMGRIALELGDYIYPGQSAIWCHFSLAQVQKLGFSNFTEFTMDNQNRQSLEYKVTENRKCLFSGVFPTNDPSNSKLMLSLLFVGESDQSLRDRYPHISKFLEKTDEK